MAFEKINDNHHNTGKKEALPGIAK